MTDKEKGMDMKQNYKIGTICIDRETNAKIEVIAHRHGSMVVERINGGCGVWNDTNFLLMGKKDLISIQELIELTSMLQSKYVNTLDDSEAIESFETAKKYAETELSSFNLWATK